MSASRRYLAVAIGISCSGAFGLVACNDDSTSAPAADGGVDASNSVEETGAGSSSGQDATIADSGNGDATTKPDAGDGDDAGKPTEAGVDAGPTATEATLSTGFIRLGYDIAFAEFWPDDLDVRWSNSPECITIVRSPAKTTQATAGVVTIGGDVVGKDGGPAAPVTLKAADGYGYGGDPILTLSNSFTVDVSEGPAAPAFVALPVQTLPTSPSLAVAIKSPVAGADPIEVPATKPWALEWTVPAGAGDLTKQRLIVELTVTPVAENTGRNVNLYCGFPLTAGKASIPAEVLADMRTRVGGTGAGGYLSLFVGGHSITSLQNTTTYIVEAARDNSTDFPQSTAITLK